MLRHPRLKLCCKRPKDHEEHLERKSLVLSIHTRFASQILAGTKTIELRRVRPSLASGATLFVYETHPTKAMIGMARITGVQAAPVKELWASVHDRAGVTEAEFFKYFQGCEIGYGLELEDPVPFEHQLSLNCLRVLLPAFVAPQSMRYVCEERTARIRSAAFSDAPSAHHLFSRFFRSHQSALLSTVPDLTCTL